MVETFFIWLLGPNLAAGCAFFLGLFMMFAIMFGVTGVCLWICFKTIS